jgi:Winged helix DNA-binding domain
MRQAAQLLHRPRRSGPAALVRHLLGVQAQVLSAAGLALRARTEGLTEAKVDRARLHDRSIVLTWAMRGTLHLVPAEDYGWVVPLMIEPHVANSHRRLRELGVTGDQPARAVQAIERMLAREGPLTRPGIAERLRTLGIRTEGQAIAHLVWLAAAERAVCFGPDRGRDRSFVLVHDWIGTPEPMNRERALAEVAVRYLRAHGPAAPADLAFWSGLRAADAARGWAAIADRLTEVEVAGGTMGTLRSRRREVAPAGPVRLLPSFDEYLLGWKDRRFIAEPTRWRTINPGGGWYHPAVVADGRAVGTWATERRREDMRLEARPFSRLVPAIRQGITAEADDLAAYLRTPVNLAFV